MHSKLWPALGNECTEVIILKYRFLCSPHYVVRSLGGGKHHIYNEIQDYYKVIVYSNPEKTIMPSTIASIVLSVIWSSEDSEINAREFMKKIVWSNGMYMRKTKGAWFSSIDWVHNLVHRDKGRITEIYEIARKHSFSFLSLDSPSIYFNPSLRRVWGHCRFSNHKIKTNACMCLL